MEPEPVISEAKVTKEGNNEAEESKLVETPPGCAASSE